MQRRGGIFSRTAGVSALVAAVATLAAGCGGGTPATATDGTHRPTPSSSAAATHSSGTAAAGASATAAASAGAGTGAMAVDPALWARWGLTPLAPTPAPPVDRPVKLTRTGPVPVVSAVPTTQKVVFITIDDGAEKDPQFVRMMQDLRVPFTMFLMNDAIRSDYGYFRPLQALGNSIQNHTLHHPAMNTLSGAAQRQEVCGDQTILTRQFGAAPFLFRPPYGAGADSTGLNAAVQACGPRAVVLWKETMQITGMQYQTADHRLRDGDIILAHFRGPSELKGETMTKMFANLLKRIQQQGFTVARLDDYVQRP